MEKEKIRVLLIEDNPADRRLIQEFFKESEIVQLDLDTADRLSSGIEQLNKVKFDVILLDLILPDSQGLDTFRSVSAAAAAIPIVVLSQLGNEATAIQAIQWGAEDYLVKDRITPKLLILSLRFAMERRKIEAKSRFVAKLSHEMRTPLQEIVGTIELLKGSALSQEQSGLVERIKDGASSLLTILDDAVAGR